MSELKKEDLEKKVLDCKKRIKKIVMTAQLIMI